MTQIGDLKLYNMKEASGMLGLGYETLRQYIKSNKIKAKKLGNKYMIAESALKEYFVA